MASDSLKPSAIGASLPRPTSGSTSSAAQSESVRPGADRDVQSSTAVPSGSGGEKVRISKAARELLRQSELMADARQSLDQQPQLRSDRVAQVRARLEAGVYDTKAVKDELADRLVHILGDLPYQQGRSGDSD